MDFGSDFIFVGDKEDEDEQDLQEEEDVMEQDYRHGAALQGDSTIDNTYGFECEIMEDDEECKETPVTFSSAKTQKPSNKINTNTISLKMASLKEPAEDTLFTQPIRCENPKCGACYSDIDDCKDGEPWNCKFCGTVNPPNNWPMIKVQDVLYASKDKIPCMDYNETEQTIIFVIDISESMGRTMRIQQMTPTLQEIVASEYADYLREMSQIVGTNIVADPNVRIMDASWLQVVKAAIIDQLAQVKDKYFRENKKQPKVGLITFGDIVTLYKDGWLEPIQIEGGQLADRLELLRLGSEHYQLGPLAETCRSIENCIRKLKCNGQTALGPALVVAQGMVVASKGSKIIVCTDGESNVGIGNVDSYSKSDVKQFYREVINLGKDNGTSISFLSFDTCDLETLGVVAEETGGIVDRINPTQLGSRLKEELNRTTIATNALIKFVVHKSMYIQVFEDQQKESSLDYSIGNIQADKQVPFCFAPRSHGDGLWQPSDFSDPRLAELGYPFQVQINFTDMKGQSACRVWTKCKPVTKSRREAQTSMNQNTVVENFMQTAAKLLRHLVNKPSELKIEAQNIVEQINQMSKQRSHSSDAMLYRKLMEFSTLASEIIHSRDIKITEETIAKLFKVQDLRAIGN